MSLTSASASRELGTVLCEYTVCLDWPVPWSLFPVAADDVGETDSELNAVCGAILSTLSPSETCLHPGISGPSTYTESECTSDMDGSGLHITLANAWPS
ncbi:hypothetical protein GGF41_001754 [Coemansia sp. RSA 2531]|nr:hypothetical protein GGF41_001754 [Coemansia sp. RSA 2531]